MPKPGLSILTKLRLVRWGSMVGFFAIAAVLVRRDSVLSRILLVALFFVPNLAPQLWPIRCPRCGWPALKRGKYFWGGLSLPTNCRKCGLNFRARSVESNEKAL